MSEIRALHREDLPFIKEVIDSNELFPSEMLDEMTADFFTDENTQDIWLTKVVGGIPVAVAYCAPERMTAGTYNLYLIAVHKNRQGRGVGTEIMACVENLVRKKEGRILIVETSGLPEFELTRHFYDQLGYERAAVIKEFYQEGEDKIVFWKKIR